MSFITRAVRLFLSSMVLAIILVGLSAFIVLGRFAERYRPFAWIFLRSVEHGFRLVLRPLPQEIEVSFQRMHSLWAGHERQRKVEIHSPPGRRLHVLTDFLFSRKVCAEIFEPTLVDLYNEYCSALQEGRIGKARWVRVRGYWSFWSAFAMQLPLSAAKRIVSLWKLIP